MRYARILPGLICLAGAAGAEEPTRALTIDDALQMARVHNRDIATAREHLNQVASEIDKAWVALLPTVNAQGKYTLNNREVTLDLSPANAAPGSLQGLNSQLQLDTVADLYNGRAPSALVLQETDQIRNYCKNNPSSADCQAIVIQKQHQLDFALSATVPLVVPWAWHQLKAARDTLAWQRKTTDGTEVQILIQVAVAFYAAASSDERTIALRHGVEVAKRTADDARTRFEAGVVNRVEVARADVALLRAGQTLREQADIAVTSYRLLRTLVGMTGPFHVVPPPEPAPVPRDAPEIVRAAFGLRREVLSIEGQIVAARDSEFSAKLRWAPTLSAFGLLRAFNYAGFANQNYAWALGLQVDWLIYDGGARQALLKQFSSVEREARIRLDATKDQISDDIANLLGNLETKRAGLATARREVELARETLELVRAQREAGTATQLDLLTSQDTLLLAELTVANLRFDLGLTELRLRQAEGTFR